MFKTRSRALTTRSRVQTTTRSFSMVTILEQIILNMKMGSLVPVVEIVI